MAALVWLVLLISVPLVLFVGMAPPLYLRAHPADRQKAWLILSSCLGDSFRLRISNVTVNPRQALFDRNYLRGASSGQGTWNQIEMADMLGDSPRSSMDSDSR
jgi:hypothetical protein